MKKLTILLLLSFYSTTASAGLLSNIWESLKQMLGINISKTVNNYVTPPQADCETTPATNPLEVTAPSIDETEVEVPEEGEETEVGFGVKSDSDADYLRDILKSNFSKLGGDPIALEQALCFYDKNRGVNFAAAGDPSRNRGIKIQNQRYITINDLNKSYFQSRMYVLDLETGKVKSYYSAHGIGGKKGIPESDARNAFTSNVDGSNASPRGFFITGSRINGSSDPKQRWKFSMKLHGLQQGVNDKSYSRAVVMHSFPDVTNDVATSDDENPSLRTDPYPFHLSQGCPMIGPQVANEIIDTIKAPNNSSGGSLYYNYSSEEKSRGETYCGDENLMKK